MQNERIRRRECSYDKNHLKFAKTKCKMLNNGSSESDDSEIEAICRRTRGHDKVLAIELEKKNSYGKNKLDNRETVLAEKTSTEDENENEMVLLPAGDDSDFPRPQIMRVFFLNLISCAFFRSI